MAVSVATKKAVIERDGGFCLMALSRCLGEAQTTHHRANRGSGGSPVLDHPANLVAVCTICNADAEDAGALLRFDLIERGLRVEKAATNAATLERSKRTPVEYLTGQLWFLISATERRREDEEWTT